MKILLAVDTSAASRVAIDQLASRPWPANSQVRVLTAVDSSQPFALAPVVEQINERARQLVEAAAKKLRSSGLSADAAVGDGDPMQVIVDQAAAMGAELIVMGAHGSSAVERFLLGSVSRAVLRHAHCSVELVRPSVDGQAFRVLLAVDGSDGSLEAVKLTAARPWPATTEFRVLSVVDMQLSLMQASFEIPALDTHLEAQRGAAMQRTEDAIDSARRILEAAGFPSSPVISVLVASPEEVILHEATEWPADWIILGSHGHGGLDRFLLGSTTETVATHAPCSVAVMRAARS